MKFKIQVAKDISTILYLVIPSCTGILIFQKEIVTFIFKRGKFDENDVVLVSGALFLCHRACWTWSKRCSFKFFLCNEKNKNSFDKFSRNGSFKYNFFNNFIILDGIKQSSVRVRNIS